MSIKAGDILYIDTLNYITYGIYGYMRWMRSLPVHIVVRDSVVDRSSREFKSHIDNVYTLF